MCFFLFLIKLYTLPEVFILQTLIQIDYTMRVQGHHAVDQVEKCATEIAGFLNNLSNWDEPIFPDVPNCAKLEVVPPYFNTSGTFWYCGSQVTDGES